MPPPDSTTTSLTAAIGPYIGTAGWTIPGDIASCFVSNGSHLARYASQLTAVEINSSFRRSHRRATYVRWAASVQDGFRFSVKVPKEITHVRKLVAAEPLLRNFLADAGGLESRLGCLLVQLPPSLAFVKSDVDVFFDALRDHYLGDVAVEPRHISWFCPESERLFESYRLARVAADPAFVLDAGVPGGSNTFAYWRLHGSPRTYYSSYSEADLDRTAAAMSASCGQAHAVWCIFDNTALGAATANALAMKTRFGTTK